MHIVFEEFLWMHVVQRTKTMKRLVKWSQLSSKETEKSCFQPLLKYSGHRLSRRPSESVALFVSTGTMVFPPLAFWVTNGLLLLVDITGKPAFITRYRIQVDKNNPVRPLSQYLLHFCEDFKLQLFLYYPKRLLSCLAVLNNKNICFG